MGPRFVRRRRLLVLLALVALGACSHRGVPLRPGTGGIRAHIHGAAHAILSVRLMAERSTAVVGDMTDGVGTAVNLAPGYYDVAVSSPDGRGGFYDTLGGNGVRVLVGRMSDVTVSLEDGIAIEGRVVDAVTHAPLGGVVLGPPERVASVTWPVPLPCLFAAGRPDGAFLIGGLGASPDQGSVVFARPGYRTQTIALPASSPRAHLRWDVALEPVAAPP